MSRSSDLSRGGQCTLQVDRETVSDPSAGYPVTEFSVAGSTQDQVDEAGVLAAEVMSFPESGPADV
jgi:hypothetical protein